LITKRIDKSEFSLKTHAKLLIKANSQNDKGTIFELFYEAGFNVCKSGKKAD